MKERKECQRYLVSYKSQYSVKTVSHIVHVTRALERRVAKDGNIGLKSALSGGGLEEGARDHLG